MVIFTVRSTIFSHIFSADLDTLLFKKFSQISFVLLDIVYFTFPGLGLFVVYQHRQFMNCMDSGTTSLRIWSHKISLTHEFNGVAFLVADRSSFDGRSKKPGKPKLRKELYIEVWRNK